MLQNRAVNNNIQIIESKNPDMAMFVNTRQKVGFLEIMFVHCVCDYKSHFYILCADTMQRKLENK